MKNNAATVALIKQLPDSIKKKLSITDLVVIEGLASIVDRIHSYFATQHVMQTEVRKFKRLRGICGGEITCMVHTGSKVVICRGCKVRKANPKRQNGRSEYGRIMLKRRRAASK